MERTGLRAHLLIVLGAGAGCHWGRCENFSKDKYGYETFWIIFEHCGMTYCIYFSKGYENFSTEIEGVQNY